jgi:Skp family chaperone for outer membrane proteins
MDKNMNEMSIATICLERVLSESDEGRRITAEIEQSEKAKRTEFNEQVEEILVLRAKYFASAASLPSGEQSRLRQEIAQMELRVARMEEAILQEMQQRRGAVLADFERLIFPLIEQLAEANGIALVLQQPQRNLVYSAREIDITDSVIEALDERTEAVCSLSV